MKLLIAITALVVSTLAPPAIETVTPPAPTVSDRPQTVAVTGSGFLDGLKLLVTDPGGAIRTLAGQDIQARRESSFQATVTFATAGTYSFVVINPDGAKSNLVSVQARSGGVKPSIEQIAPDETMKSAQEQAITITGSYFAQGATVSVTDPAGAVATIRTLEKNTAQTIVVRMVLDQTGTYSIVVVNPGGEASNAVPLKVN
jgi:IPT/TIG domain